MQLTGFSKFLIVLVVVGLIGFGLLRLRDAGMIGGKTTDKTEQTDGDNTAEEGKTSNNSDESDKKADDAKPSSSVSEFNYTPKEPVNGTLKGVVELGASGFNMFIINVDKDKNWKQEKAEFGSSLVAEGMTSGKDVKETLKNYIANIVNFGVSTKNIHFVVSSGAAQSDKIPDIMRALKQMGYIVNTVTPEQEGKLALSCVLPKEFYEDSYIVDIGSGNTKISWAAGADLASAKSVESHGAKYFQKGTSEATVSSDVAAAAAKIPQKNRTTCFIIGGIPFELAKKSRNGKERYTVLKMPKDYTPEGEKQKAGLNIYKAIQAQTKTDTFVFDWSANFTIGFLLGLK
jgi:Sec-independent protein translocase protein TatA